MADENTPFRLIFTKKYVATSRSTNEMMRGISTREFKIYVCLDGRVYIFPV